MSEREGVIGALNRIQGLAAAAAVLGVIGCVAGFASDRTLFMQCYLFAFIFWVGLTLGCFGLTMLHHMIRGRFTAPVLRMFEAGNRNLWLMALLFVPVLLAIWGQQLYPWALPASQVVGKGMREALAWKAPFLNPQFFTARAIIYFVIWIIFAAVLNRSSNKQDETGDPALMEGRASISAPGLVVYILTVTFAFTDWVMSLDPRWYSTIYGIWFVVSQGLSATAFTIILFASLRKYKPFSDEATPERFRDLGNLLLTFTMFWGYFSLSQWLIIYSGNLPEEVVFYLHRGLTPSVKVWTGIYWFMGTAIVIGQFFAPFIFLVSGKAKRTPELLASIAAMVFFVRILDIFWNTIPFFHPQEVYSPRNLIWMGPAAWLGMGGIWLFCYLLNLKRYPLIPRHAVVVEEALEHA